MRKILSSLTLASLLLVPIHPSVAGGCYVDPVHEHAWSGSIISGVFMRDDACISGTTILVTLAAGSNVNVVGETDGWYYVESNGNRGWVGEQFVRIASRTSEGKTWDSYAAFMQANPSKKAIASPPTTTDDGLITRVRGYIVLDVQSRGEAWYVNPTTDRRYYMRDGAAAYDMMRSFGLGVTEADYEKMVRGDYALKQRLRGRIILRVQQHGEAYYIHPRTLALHYLKDGPAAYDVMRLYGLGITSYDLTRIAQ